MIRPGQFRVARISESVTPLYELLMVCPRHSASGSYLMDVICRAIISALAAKHNMFLNGKNCN